MKKFLFAFVVLFVGCSSEPLPEGFNLKGDTENNRFAFEWDSNQVEPFVKFIVMRQGVPVVEIDNIKNRHFEHDLKKGDIIRVSINYSKTAERPECTLKISKKINGDIKTGSYNPEDYKIQYCKTSFVNAVGYAGQIDNNLNLIVK